MTAPNTAYDEAVATLKGGCITCMAGAVCSLLGALTALYMPTATPAFVIYLASTSVFTLCALVAISRYADERITWKTALHALHVAAHWLLYTAAAMTVLVIASILLTGQTAAIVGVLTAAVVLMAGNTTTPRRRT
ncbi:hypothetical protein [Streptomyces prunicolor]